MKKTFLISILCLCSFISYSQYFEIDPETKKYSYSIVVRADSLTKSQIFKKSLVWYDRYFKSRKNVVQASDSIKGKITGRASFLYLVGIRDCPVSFSIFLTVKDNRFKFEASDFYWGTPPHVYTFEEKPFPGWNDRLQLDTMTRLQEIVASLSKEVIGRTRGRNDW